MLGKLTHVLKHYWIELLMAAILVALIVYQGITRYGEGFTLQSPTGDKHKSSNGPLKQPDPVPSMEGMQCNTKNFGGELGGAMSS